MEKAKKRLPEWVLYTGSSMVSGALDYGVYFLLTRLILAGWEADPAAIHVSFTAARFCGGLCNFAVNETIVFGSGLKGRDKAIFRPGWPQRAGRYFLMAALITFLGNGLLAQLHTLRALHDVAAKGITDLAMFILGYGFQRFFVFQKKTYKNRKYSSNRPERETK